MITSDNTPNLPGWIDLGSPDPAASAEFYRQVFGWTSEPSGGEPPANEYFMLRKDGQIVGGLGGLQNPAAKPDWTVYVRVPDAEGTIQTAERNGGKTRVPFMPVGPQGGFAQLTDPAGAEVALWQPGTTIGGERCF